MTTTYRKAVPADAPFILDFQVAMARETEDLELDREVCAAGVRAVFEDPARGEYFVGEADGRVICSLLITYEWSDWRNGVVWWIQSLYVVPEARGGGVYKGLYQHIREVVAGDDRVRGIRLYVDRRNTGAQAVYVRLGMDGEHYQVFEWMK
ncbi:MAG: GNAT family N-acetyltransferase [Blastocatellia bacterium]|nr:GNAT family N-acetyltransferase [Blastocatellia bacterium]